MRTIHTTRRWLGRALACGIITFAACVYAQRPVILSFEPNGFLTWSNAYPDAIASVERLSDVVTTGSVVTVTETLGISDGLTAIHNYTVAHPPIVSPSVTISDGTYSWNDQTGSSSPANFLGTVSSYASGQVSAIYLSVPAATGTVIQVEYSYLPLSTNQEWLGVYSAQATNQIMQVAVDMSEEMSLFRVVNRPPRMVLIPGGSNSGMNTLGIAYGNPESHDPCSYPPTYSLSVGSFYMDRYEVTNDDMVEVMQWAYGHGRISATSATVRNLEGDQHELLDLDSPDCRITWDGSSFGIKPTKGTGYPCVEVTWYGAAAYCNYRSEIEGRTPCYDLSDWTCNLSAGGYRLPTSEEWEYAARGGAVSKRFPWGGDTISHSQANYHADDWYDYGLSNEGYHPDYNDGETPYTSPVGSFAANAWGLYDMAGNVWEWCNDSHPCCGSSNYVVRGGSWFAPAECCRVGHRACNPAGYRNGDMGFRAVLPASP